MTEQELQQLRRAKWRLDGRPVRTLDDAKEFIESVGFCLMYPLRPPLLVPTFIGAFAGTDERLPTWQHAFADPRALEATELMVRLLRERAAYEANPFGETNFLVSASVFPYFYGLVGDRNPRHMPKSGQRDYSPLAQDAFEVIRQTGATPKRKLREVLGQEYSDAPMDRALRELWSKLRITRVDYNRSDGAFWDALYNWAPEAVREGMNVSVPEALSALLSKYLDCVIAADQQEITDFFSHFVSRSKISESLNTLLATRELSFVAVEGRSTIAVTPPKAAPRPASPQRAKIIGNQGQPLVPPEKRHRKS